MTRQEATPLVILVAGMLAAYAIGRAAIVGFGGEEVNGLAGWSELDLEGKASVLWSVAGIVACTALAYSAVRMVKTQKKLERRLHLDGEDGGSLT